MTKEELESFALDTSKKLDEVSAELEYYKELFRSSQAKRFGQRSEKNLIDDGEQVCLFNEAEQELSLIHIEMCRRDRDGVFDFPVSPPPRL